MLIIFIGVHPINRGADTGGNHSGRALEELNPFPGIIKMYLFCRGGISGFA